MPHMQTPGVYIEEINAFANSVVTVATAVPAFVGHTAQAQQGGKSLASKPWKIPSMAEFEACFGAAPTALFSMEVHADPTSPPMFETGPPGDRTGYNLARVSGCSGGRFLLHASMNLFFQNGGGPCYVVSVGNFDDDPSATALLGGIEALRNEAEPTLLVVPDAVLLDEGDCIEVQQAMLAHCGDLRSRFAIIDLHGGYRARVSTQGDPVASFRAAIGNGPLSFGAAYYPWLHTTVVQAEEIGFQNFSDSAQLADLLGAESDPANKQLAQVLAELGQPAEHWAGHVTSVIDALRRNGEAARPLASDELEQAIAAGKRQLDARLRELSPVFNKIVAKAVEAINLLPPSAVIAGVYARVDNAQGVWKAPANASLNGVASPAVLISDHDQQDLNVAIDGKSVNAIRSFIGKGTLVWGARTLDGNSADWRYVNVRRTMIMIEQSCSLVLKAYVLESNDSNTWVTLKSLLSNFLVGLWNAGAMAGSVPHDAFSVQVGLGETMTQQDLLEGRLRVSVMVAITRPAEFIVISLQQQMQKS